MQSKIFIVVFAALLTILEFEFVQCQLVAKGSIREPRQGPVCCLTEVGDDVEVRPGTCPNSTAVYCPASSYSGCDDQCHEDDDCPEPQKCCCSDRCGNQCVTVNTNPGWGATSY